MGLDPWAVAIIKRGYQISFHTRPPLSLHPVISSTTHSSRDTLLEEQFHILLSKGAIEEVLGPPSPGFYSRLFLVPKPNGTWRPVIDLSLLNDFIYIPTFKMDTPQLIRQSLHPQSWVYSLDLTDAYFHIPIHPRSRKFLRLEFKGRIFQFRALPFGISTAPWLFTKVVGVVKQLLHSKAYPLFQYLDDWLGSAHSQSVAQDRAQALVALCDKLGFLVNFEKSDLVPSQQFDFVGVHYDLQAALVMVTVKNQGKVTTALSTILEATCPTAHMWLKLIGVLTSQELLVPFGKLHKRPIQWHLRDHWSQCRDPLHFPVPLTPHILPDLLWWSDISNLTQGVPLHFPPFTHRLFTDASTKGWGAHFQHNLIQSRWSQSETLLHINVLELRAVRLALQHFQFPPQSSVLVASDNLTVVSYINNQGGTRSRSLWLETRLLFSEFPHLNIRARHIPGKLNVIADQLSRQGHILPTEWILLPEVVQELFARWGTPNIDLFATSLSNQCPVYVSPVPDPQAWEVDAFSISWNNLHAYAYPPTKLLLPLLKKLEDTDSFIMILIAPLWPKQVWYPLLLDLTIAEPVPLPLLPKLLRQPRSNLFHTDPAKLNLHAWLLQKGN